MLYCVRIWKRDRSVNWKVDLKAAVATLKNKCSDPKVRRWTQEAISAYLARGGMLETPLAKYYGECAPQLVCVA